MAPINIKTLTMPLAAFGMVFVLGSFIYTSISSAKREASHQRERHYVDILEQRKGLGIDAWDQRKERSRLRDEMEKTKAEASANADARVKRSGVEEER